MPKSTRPQTAGPHIQQRAERLARLQAARRLSGQFIRYGLVGTVAAAVDFSVLYLLTEWAGLHYLVSVALAFSVALTLSYVLAIAWVFDFRSLDNRLHEFLVYCAVGVVGLLLTEGVMYGLTEGVGLHYIQSKVAATIVVLFYNFTAKKLLLFSPAYSRNVWAALGQRTKVTPIQARRGGSC